MRKADVGLIGLAVMGEKKKKNFFSKVLAELKHRRPPAGG